jgi:hypothetical protein
LLKDANRAGREVVLGERDTDKDLVKGKSVDTLWQHVLNGDEDVKPIINYN